VLPASKKALTISPATNSAQTTSNIDVKSTFGILLTQNASSGLFLSQSIELVDAGDPGNFIVGENIVVSFTAHTTTPGTIDVFGFFRDVAGSGTNSVDAFTSQGVSITSTITRFDLQFTITGNPGGTNILLEIALFNASTTMTDLTISRIQVEEGAVVTDFEERPIGEELALAQRYYQRYESTGGVNHIGAGYAFGTTVAEAVIALPTAMRVDPTSTIGGAVSPIEIRHGAFADLSDDTVINDEGNQSIRLISTVSSGVPLTPGEGILLRVRPLVGAFIDFDAEL